ncbi:hypothetical protein HY635_01805 [Candidatus Uhrbacteria bacterium]|nr:hypothetical protein [Candidatus Uhrbacteria bacterium]
MERTVNRGRTTARARRTMRGHHRHMDPLPEYTIARLRAALGALRALRTLQRKLPKDSVAWQRQLRKEGDREHQILRAWGGTRRR